MESRIRTRLIVPAVLGALVFAIVLSVALTQRRGEADVIPGQFSMEVDVTPTQADVGTTFTATVSIVHAGPAYQAAQWDIDYDETVVKVNSMTRVPGPDTSTCISRNDDGTRVLLGCIDLAGANITYSGPTFTVVFECIASGPSPLTLQNFTGDQPSTFVTDGIVNFVVHTHNDSVFCGTPPPTETPTSTPTAPPSATATDTPTRTATATVTPTNTPSPTPTIPVPPDQDQFRQIAFNPASYLTGQALLDAVDMSMELQISTGWTVRDSAAMDAGDGTRLLYAIQRRPGGPSTLDLNNDLVIDLEDALAVVNEFGGVGTADAFKHTVIDPLMHPTGASLLAAMDAAAETEIAAGWNSIDSALVMLDGTPKVVLSFQLRQLPDSPDVNGDAIVDLRDALIVLNFFSTPVDPDTPQPVPPGPNRSRQVVYDPASFANATAMLTRIDKDMEKEIIEAYDAMDSSLLSLDLTSSLVYSSMRSLRQHRADLFDDDVIDLRDALEVLMHFGEAMPSIFKQLPVDPSGSSTANDLILATDPVMEAQIALGFDVHDSELVTLDGSPRVLWSLQLEEIPDTWDLDGDQYVDLRDALVALSLFGAPVEP